MSTPSTRSRKVVIRNVRVFDGLQLEERVRDVLIDDGLIGAETTSDANADEVVDGTGCTLLPGLIDAHVHITHEADLLVLASYGITTAMDMACWPTSKVESLRAFSRHEAVTEMRSAGLPATATGSLHSKVLPELPSQALIDGAEGAEQFVDDRIKEGSDYIKMIADVPGPSQATLDAISFAAQARGKITITHSSMVMTWKMAVNSGTNLITHCPRDGVTDDKVVSEMVSRKQVVVPTLVMMEGICKGPSFWAALGLLTKPSLLMSIISIQKTKRRLNPNAKPDNYENCRQSITRMHAAGIPIFAGTDANSLKQSPAPCPLGPSFHRELVLLVQAGLSPLETLRAATSGPAQFFGMDDRGLIQVGKRADLVMVTGNPLVDIGATAALRRVWIGGKQVQRIASTRT